MRIVKSSIENLRINRSELFNAEKKVADYILDNLQNALKMNVAQLANGCGVSNATVIRMCKHLGYKGYYQLRLMLAQDVGGHKIIDDIHTQIEINSVETFFKVCASNMIHIGKSISNEDIDEATDAIIRANTVHLIAFGNTCNVSIDFAFRLSRMKIATTSSQSDELALSSINLARYGDVIIGISHSGGSDCVIQALTIARSKGLTTIAITDTKDSPMEDIADYTLCTSMENSETYVFGAESHVNMYSVVDLLLYIIAKKKNTPNGLEMFFSETQIDN